MEPATRGETSHMLLALHSSALELTFHVVQRAAGKEALALPFRHIKDSHKCETVELDGDFSVATLEARPDIAEHQPCAPLHPLIIPRFREDEGKNAEVAEVRLMDAGKTLRDLRSHPEITR